MEAELNMQVTARLKMFTTNFISSRIVNELSTKVFRITGGENQGLLHSVKEYQKLLNSIKEYKIISKSIKSYPRVLKSIRVYQRVSQQKERHGMHMSDRGCA